MWQREPDIVVIAQSWPAQVSAAEIARLRRRLPLARFCALLDSWCEGELRSGEPWPAAIRLYVHHWAPRASRELLRLVRSQPSAWGLPVTASDEQRLLAGLAPPGGATGQVAVVASNPESAAALGDACRSAGYQVAEIRHAAGVMLPGVCAVVWDTTCESATDATIVAAIAAQLWARRPVVALLGFPRADEIAAAKAAGVAAVISKPFLVEDLHWQLADVISRGADRQSKPVRQSNPSIGSINSVRRISRFHSAS